MKRPALLAAVLGVVLCIAGMCLRGIAGDVMAMVLVGGGAVTCVAGLVWLLSGRRRTRCPNCGAAVNTARTCETSPSSRKPARSTAPTAAR